MTLSATTFDRSVKHRIISDSECNSVVSTNVAGGPCLLKSIIIDNTQGSATNWVRCANGTSSTIGSDQVRVSVPCVKQSKTVVEFPDGIPFELGLSFWCSGNESISSSTAPSTTVNTGKIIVTLVLG